eukprot:4944057-Pleurochrysis_carterae.AAC.3
MMVCICRARVELMKACEKVIVLCAEADIMLAPLSVFAGQLVSFASLVTGFGRCGAVHEVHGSSVV